MIKKLIFFLILAAGWVSAQTTPATKSLNGIAIATQYVGSDIGAQINAAIAAVRCGEVYIPAGSYSQSTTIVQPRCVKLHGAAGNGTTLTWTPKSNWAVVVADSMGASTYPEGAIEDLTLVGPGAGTATGGIYIGGSDGSSGSPSSSIDPSTNYGDNVNINRVRVFNGFGTGIQWGNNAWATTIFESTISNNGVGLYYPAGLTNSGENLSLVNSKVQNYNTIGLKLGVSSNLDFYCVDTEFDNFSKTASWAIQNGTSASGAQLSMTGCHVETVDHWLQNYGYTYLVGDYFTNGTNSGALGYLIDNEADALTIIGGSYLNSGSGAILNSRGVGSSWIGATVNTPLTPTLTNIDRFGNTSTVTLYSKTLNQLAASQYSGRASCASGSKAISLPVTYSSQPAILVFDETTKGGTNLSAASKGGFTVSCVGANDVFDWIVVGNPN